MITIKKEKIFFSIIVPAYNSSNYIKKCVESVLEQTYSDFELILVDDGSTDDTLSICNSYNAIDSRVKVIHKENGGHTSARNEGLRSSVGEYVIFLDSDDWISYRTLEICRNEIIANSPDIVIYRMQNSNCDDPYAVLIADGHYKLRDLNKNNVNDFIISKEGNFLFPKSLSAKCFRRDVIYESQLRIPSEILIGEDGAAFIGAILESESISVVAGNMDACYYCFVRSDSISRSADIDAFHKMTVLLLYYDALLRKVSEVYLPQFNRNVVAQLYTATLLVIRSGGKSSQLNSGLHTALQHPVISIALKKAKFNLKGYKFIIKKLILRYRLWALAKILDG